MTEFEKILSGGDLRSIGKSNAVVSKIKDQNDFNELFKLLFHKNRIVVMRAADAIEKITAKNPHYLNSHKNEVIKLCGKEQEKELKWHLALLIPRLQLKGKACDDGVNTLKKWLLDKTNSKIVRVNAIQGFFEMVKQNEELMGDFIAVLKEIKPENIPSINARIKIISKVMGTTI